MRAPRLVAHDHEPLLRVVRAGWVDPLDVSFSRARRDNRWNPPDAYAALYTCCSEGVARGVTLDLYRLAGIVLDDLQPVARPQLVEIGWDGEVVDVASAEGVAEAGFPPTYPVGVDPSDTQPVAAAWHAVGYQGVVCRSASLARLGVGAWNGPHQRWGELAIFVERARRRPELLRRRDDLDWLRAGPTPAD